MLQWGHVPHARRACALALQHADDVVQEVGEELAHTLVACGWERQTAGLARWVGVGGVLRGSWDLGWGWGELVEHISLDPKCVWPQGPILEFWLHPWGLSIYREEADEKVPCILSLSGTASQSHLITLPTWFGGLPRWCTWSRIPSAKEGDRRHVSSTPGLGRSPGEGNGNPFQYCCLGNPMDRGAWWAIVHRVTKESDTTE